MSVGEQFAVENRAFSWLQGYETELPERFSDAFYDRAQDKDSEELLAAVSSFKPALQQLAMLYFAGFAEQTIAELYGDNWYEDLFGEPEAYAETVEANAEHEAVAALPAPEHEVEQEPAPDLPRSFVSPQSRASESVSPWTGPEVPYPRIPKLNWPGEWAADALCAQTDPEIFYPEKGSGAADAKRICKQCPVRQECLQHAISNGERFGVWGGLSERHRRRLAKR